MSESESQPEPQSAIQPASQPGVQPEPTSGERYIVREGDTLIGIARRAYHDDNPILWQKIYVANAPTIGDDPRLLVPGTELFIPHNPRQIEISVAQQCCSVSVSEGLRGRSQPNTTATITGRFPQGTNLCFNWVEFGEPVNGNRRWGFVSELNSYFWMGGTSCP